MSRVMYNSKRLIPAPLVSLTKQYQSTEDGTKIGSSWSINITGTLVAFMGSPSSSGSFWTAGGFPPDETIPNDSRLAAVIRKGEAIRELFSEDGHMLEFQSEDGSQPLKCNPKVQSVNLAEGQWYDRLQYSITLTADVIYVNGTAIGEDGFSQYIESASENWQIDTNEEPESINLPRTYKLTHTVNAKGKRFFDSAGALSMPAWEQARSWVIPKLGIDSSIMSSSGVRDLPSYYGGYNHLRSESIDKYNGSYSVTEVWLLASGNALETYEISTSTSSDNTLTKVSIDGSITGLESRNPSNMNLVNSKYTNASNKFTQVSGLFISRAQDYSNVSLNIVPISTSVGRSPVQGTIRYNYEFDNRPTNIITGSRSESITITDSLPTDFCVPIFVLGRTNGPVLQNLNTSKERTRGLSIEAAMPFPSGSISDMVNQNPRVSSATSGLIEGIIEAAKPVGTQVYVQDRNESWDIKTGRYSYNTTWIWEL